MAAILGLLAIAACCPGQTAQPSPDGPVRVRKLTIVADGVPRPDLGAIAQSLEGRIDLPEIIEERVRQSFRDRGYYFVVLRSSKTTIVPVSPAENLADISIEVEPGDRYSLGEITFRRNQVFSSSELRRQFAIRSGSVFSAKEIANGLDRLRAIYVARGYADFGAIPQPRFDSVHRRVSLTIDVDEGRPYRFGALMLDGAEPRAGIGRSLLAAWNRLKGTIYSPQALRSWLAECGVHWPKGELEAMRTENVYDRDTQQMDVRLEFPQE